MKRRAFLSFLGGAAVAGPSAAKTAAELTMADIGLPGIAKSALSGYGSGELPGSAVSPSDSRVWAAKSLKRLIGMTDLERERKKRSQYIDGLEPEVAGLRSVSLTNKIRMSRDRVFERGTRNELTYLEGVMAGLWE